MEFEGHVTPRLATVLLVHTHLTGLIYETDQSVFLKFFIFFLKVSVVVHREVVAKYRPINTSDLW